MTYLLSNIKSNEAVPGLDPVDDELVFLNMAVNWENYKDIPCAKHLYCRAKDTGSYFVRPDWKGKETQLFSGFEVLDTGWRFNYPNGKTPTTGFWVWQLLKEKGKDITLVNFMPDEDFTTDHWDGHDWKYEAEVYRREGPKSIRLN